MKNTNGFIVVEADNIGNDIFVSDIFPKIEIAIRVLKESYKQLTEDTNREIEYKNYDMDKYSVMFSNNDYCYGQIKKVEMYDEVKEEERKMTELGYVKKKLGLKQYWFDGDKCVKEAKRRYED